jgi:hypothetical protein
VALVSGPNCTPGFEKTVVWALVVVAENAEAVAGVGAGSCAAGGDSYSWIVVAVAIAAADQTVVDTSFCIDHSGVAC